MRSKTLLMIISLTLCLPVLSCGRFREDAPRPKTVIELDSGWIFHESGSEEWLPAAVPGTVHTDLQAAGVIPDPFFSDNEEDLQWIEKKEWIYSRTFDADRSLLDHDRVTIEFDGLDTYAEVIINGDTVIHADNMFRTWEGDIKSSLRKGKNNIEVRFLPPGPIEEEMRKELGYPLPGGDRVFTRKAAYHYGWDWGPRFVTCGIWKPARIIGWSDAEIKYLKIWIKALSDERAILTAITAMNFTSGQEVTLVLTDSSGDLRLSRTMDSYEGEKGFQKSNDFNFEWRIEKPELWWPAGLGEQNLKRYRLELYIDDVLVDSMELTFGIRQIRLLREKDAAGESFTFEVNGVPVFMKGANWVPLNSFLPSARSRDYRRLLTAAGEANMNMLRVWGGGIYENDIFYDLCDSLGIVVWQDFMLACGMYPGDTRFKSNFKKEARDNISRLCFHPCIGLWCGNNENEEGWLNWGWQDTYSTEQRTVIEKAYEELTANVIMKTLYDLDYNVNRQMCDFHPSSPEFGRADPRSLTEGDAHYWGVWHDGEPFEAFEEKIPRFMSESGFQALPSMRAIESFTRAEDRRIGSAAILAHQKHARGFDLIRQYMERWYRVPEGLEDYVYVSQILQAEGMRIGFEAQRRAMPYCMGTLYWQLNDCWPAISWSSIDFSGEWKALHYAAKKAFEPVLVSTAIEEKTLHVYIVSDRLEALGGWLTMRLTGFRGEKKWDRVVAVRADANGSSDVFSIPVETLLSGSDPRSVVFSAEFDCPGETPSRALRYFALPKDLRLPRAEVSFEVDPGDGTVLRLTSPVLARNVFLDLGGSHFSDNYFDILPGDTVAVRVDAGIPADEISDRLRIKTLRDTY